MADVHLDPERLRAHARRAETLADGLARRRRDVDRARPGDRAELERIAGGVGRVADRLTALAAELRTAAEAAEEADRAQRDVVMRRADDSPIVDVLAGRTRSG
ncbi:MAG: hypothetical protein J0I34_08185 [Pseudonocardia sp.]|uniref:hypothetical protein n=1 Tax=unclassified Pseudonocardia TaxID=2619320 RepID=UPI00086E1D6C|nr:MULTISPECIES: hypothetical protein [unclassified Pseudonocardia]MBN9108749.1 hypothetical protein [Pseudonocardia sp.]ODU21060.1 MAG: hypothetical protein ABS80_17790 [Pseudonocardia sp. SCN 72-51]ODV07637.1 MAG: hypothetical protein ABT15_05955 [Pseudonocardia sp. SCN 73-27]